jgi:putative drug exporter of the RND superfamily
MTVSYLRTSGPPWSHAVQRRPWTAAIAATAAVLALAAPALGVRLGFADAGNDPPDTMTRQAHDLNTEGFGPGTNGPLVIAAELPDARARAEIDSFAERLRSEPGVVFVRREVPKSSLGTHCARPPTTAAVLLALA